MSVSGHIKDLKDSVGIFEAEYMKYQEKGVNSAGSKARKALMSAKKTIATLRKVILDEQKNKKGSKGDAA